MVDFQFISFLLLSLSLAEFAWQIVISDLSDKVKGAMLLRQPYNLKLQTLSFIPFWRKLLGKWWFIATPFIFLLKLHKYFSELLACPFCSGFWLSFFTNIFYLKLDIITAALLAPICLVFVAILDRIHKW